MNEEPKQELRKLAAQGIDPLGWREAVYTLEEKREAAWQAILDVEDAVSSHWEDRKPRKDDLTAMVDVAQVIQTFKHEAFRDEQEMRVVCGAPMHADLMCQRTSCVTAERPCPGPRDRLKMPVEPDRQTP